MLPATSSGDTDSSLASTDSGAVDACALYELPQAGVFTPEGLFAAAPARAAVLKRLLTLTGTLNAGFVREDASGRRESVDSVVASEILP